MYGDGNQIFIKPKSFYPEQRTEASKIATERGEGLRMEVWSGHTEFHSDASVPVGKIAVYAAHEYKGWPEYEVTLDSPDDEWVPALWRT